MASGAYFAAKLPNRFRQERAINYSSPIAISHLPRENFGTWEFPVLHVRGGTSTGLIIWDRIAPKQLELREELLRHLMGLPLQGTDQRHQADHRPRPRLSDQQQGVLRRDGDQRGGPAADRQHAGAARRRQVADRLERELRQHVGRAAFLGDRPAFPATPVERPGRGRDLQHQHQDHHDRPRHARRRRICRRANPRRRRRISRRRSVHGQPGRRQDRQGAADRIGGRQLRQIHRVLRRRRGADGDRARVGIRQDRHRAGQGFAQRRGRSFRR